MGGERSLELPRRRRGTGTAGRGVRHRRRSRDRSERQPDRRGRLAGGGPPLRAAGKRAGDPGRPRRRRGDRRGGRLGRNDLLRGRGRGGEPDRIPNARRDDRHLPHDRPARRCGRRRDRTGRRASVVPRSRGSPGGPDPGGGERGGGRRRRPPRSGLARHPARRERRDPLLHQSGRIRPAADRAGCGTGIARSPLKRNQRRLVRLQETLEPHRRLLILTHDNPDPDAIASAWILGRIVRRFTTTRVTLGYGGIIGRTENRAMMDVLRIPLHPLESLDLDSFDAFALVDTQPETGNNSLPEEVGATVVFDHHPCRKPTRSVPFHDIRVDYGASATILFEYLEAAEIEPDRRLASAIFHAIRSETQNLGREAGRADQRVFLKMFPLVDNEALSQIEHARLQRSYFEMMGRAIEGTKIYAEIAVTVLGKVSNPDVVAEFADLIVRLEGIEWALCIGRYGDDLLLSIRTNNRKANAGKVIRAVVGSRGTAGGHDMIAGGKLEGAAITQVHAVRAEELIRRRLLKELGASGLRPTGLTRATGG
ncbi:MAG: hypothetical protein GF346_09330 [Candidatus Eisenbacteria bacterium]|nr:hypothetical protein [Candidatus Latescibacterota bacterium]MBD3302633.1 hypothetical protein [Candidatus Eisenbacteria bacterium]